MKISSTNIGLQQKQINKILPVNKNPVNSKNISFGNNILTPIINDWNGVFGGYIEAVQTASSVPKEQAGVFISSVLTNPQVVQPVQNFAVRRLNGYSEAELAKQGCPPEIYF